MRIRIGNFQAVDRSVRVTFTDGDFKHQRPVAAVLAEDGTYDRAATRSRAEQVALGVQAKRAAGVLVTTPASSDMPAEPEQPDEA